MIMNDDVNKSEATVTRLSVKVSAVVDEVLAETALRYYLGRDTDRVLSRDRAEAVKLMVHASFGRICVRMMGCLTDCSCGCADNSGDFLTMDIEHQPTPCALMWVHAIQHALALDVLGEALAGIDAKASEVYLRRSRELVEGVMREVSLSGVPGARIVTRY